MSTGGAHRPRAGDERSGDEPPRPPIEERNSNEVAYGAHCEPALVQPHGKKARKHELCPGWWPSHDRHRPGAGFCCSCPCHAEFDRWPGWQRHIESGDHEGDE